MSTIEKFFRICSMKSFNLSPEPGKTKFVTNMLGPPVHDIPQKRDLNLRASLRPDRKNQVIRSSPFMRIWKISLGGDSRSIRFDIPIPWDRRRPGNSLNS